MSKTTTARVEVPVGRRHLFAAVDVRCQGQFRFEDMIDQHRKPTDEE